MKTYYCLCFFLLFLGGCSGTKMDSETSNVAQPIAGALCATCSMVVREQPAPRGQLIHRDGTRVYFCSLGDLLAYQKAPSPHGKIQATFVEVLDPVFDPLQLDTGEGDWVPAAQAFFVAGIPREGIMGPPLLAYRERQQAVTVANDHGGQMQDWKVLSGK